MIITDAMNAAQGTVLGLQLIGAVDALLAFGDLSDLFQKIRILLPIRLGDLL